MRKMFMLALFFLSAGLAMAQPPGPPISPGGAADPLTVIGPASVCADQQIALWSGASNTSLQCSVLTVADTTGNLTGPSGGFAIIGGTGASDTLTLDGSAGTAGAITVGAGSTISGTLTSGIVGLQLAALGSTPVTLGVSTATGIIQAVRPFQINDAYINYLGFSTYGSVSTKIWEDAANILALKNATSAQTFRLYGTADAHATFTNYERLSLSCDGTADCTVTTETAGTGTDDVVLTVKGEGPAGTLVLDGSDDVAGSVTVTKEGYVLAGDGNHTTPGFSFAASTGIGMFNATGNELQFDAGSMVWSLNGVAKVYLPASAANGFQLAVDRPVSWGTIGGNSDTGLARNAAGVVNVTDGSTGMGSLLSLRKVTPDIDGETTTAVQSGTVWTNTGDGDGEAITLLNDPGIGVQYCFAVDVAQTITVAPSTGESLYYGTDQCVVSLTSNSIGSTLCVTAITGGSGAKWFTFSDKGSWTCND